MLCIGHYFHGFISYAYYVIAPSLNVLRIVLYCCSVFAKEHDILLSPNKFHCIRLHITPSPVFQFPVSLQRTKLSLTNSILHLGHVGLLTSCCNDADNINARLNSFFSLSNYFEARFGHTSLPIKSKLSLNFCHSFYSSHLWDLNHR